MSQGLAVTLSRATGIALLSTHCGCSGGGGSMMRVWGAMAPARLVLLLLLMAMCFQESCAAPWRAPGAGEWAEMGPKRSSSGGRKSGCVPLALCHASLGPAFHGGRVGQGVMGSTAGAGQEPVAALLPRAGSSPAAGPWLCCLLAGAQPSLSWEMSPGELRRCVLGQA